MNDVLARIRKEASKEKGIDLRVLDMGPVVLEAGAINQAAPYLQECKYTKVVIVADSTTYLIAGQLLEAAIAKSGIAVHVTIIKPNSQGDVIADEASLVQCILDIKSKSAEAVVAVGSGTLHDIARFSAYSTSVPFISVPTAPSVDGFNSKGAPVILRGEKITIQSIGPSAIFADLDILTEAPSALVAAGFGDMLGKFTSLFDWKFGAMVGGEPFSQVVADLTENALLQCVEHVDAIAKRSPEGIRLLTDALLTSGFAMLLFGQSHSASGAEHHLSHYWEMEFLRLERRQILHGAKVGVACAEISALYHRLTKEPLPFLTPVQQEGARKLIGQVPNEVTIRQLLAAVGGPMEPTELGIDEELLERSLREAHHIRPNRYTLLSAYNKECL
ncbi:sn-glycerol-1-phosphate dehydrogenase [Paenibacillus sp. LHD-38]|uniref:sn-glycerol-1-phosphate dehydrogenase n=1 Tax=Paenibacillus sp. LHD-38 TaxID=3072143 RepID=UPI00280C9B3D|nr:sn-glycerol-1-phosphate dehydrogenase [Paenibacillus sp. LHD-38]MDQ8739269.1 sn-glycerol-1-phosphate dehydrogenase [Paenibacillus sp. LHD-38]